MKNVRPWFSVMIIAALTLLVGAASVSAGPPFFTDDPQPVDYQHWEYYTAGQYENDKGSLSGTAPHLEANYGVVPDVQLHIIAPDSFNRQKGGPALFGPGDVELGVKYRFIQESEYVPMVGAYPLFEAPTGSKSRGLSTPVSSIGTGQPQLYIPLWVQKSWGPWTSYGGGGYWINPGAGNRNYWYSGWLLQRNIFNWLSLGAEAFHITRPATDGQDETGYNVGAIFNFSEIHHFICSAGTDIQGPANFFFYAAYLITWGPAQK
jgi:hypothetical protein